MAPQPSGGRLSDVVAPSQLAILPSELSSSLDVDAFAQSGPCSSSGRTTARSEAYRPTIDMSTSSSPDRSSLPSSFAAPSGMFA